MQFGCHLPNHGALANREAVLRFCQRAEQLDVDSLWVSDHVVFPTVGNENYPSGAFPHPPGSAYMEPVALLAAVAMCTERARLGASVFILGHRNPVVMAKMLTTIDNLCAGRLICGVGVGWWREEFAALDVPFDHRGARGDEMIELFKSLWTEQRPHYQGRFYRIGDVGFAPKPLQRPHPPIWVGGHSRAAYRRAIRLGDGWHASTQTPAQLQVHLQSLREQAEQMQRPFESIEISLRLKLSLDQVQGSRQALIDLYSAYRDLGVRHLVLDFRRDDLAAMLDTLELVASELRPAVNGG
ncbi:MAG: LLM class F420-dependent oxidoreductase [Gammaproteobacteria bacterium]|nr:LLM class F420-dependent oxidoreductase [Gammaproteobacteria bacterium]